MLQSLPIHVCAGMRQRTRLQWDEMETWMEFQWLRTTAKTSAHLNAIALRVRTKWCRKFADWSVEFIWNDIAMNGGVHWANVNLQQKNCDRVRVLWKNSFWLVGARCIHWQVRETWSACDLSLRFVFFFLSFDKFASPVIWSAFVWHRFFLEALKRVTRA